MSKPNQSLATPQLRPNPPTNRSANTNSRYDTSNRDSGIDALGMSLMNGDFDDSDEEDEPSPPYDGKGALAHTDIKEKAPLHDASHPHIPIAAPRPGHPINLAFPPPSASPPGRGAVTQMPQFPSPAPLSTSPYAVPSTPHPLQEPVTPITPAFARPPKVERDVSFSEPIMRSKTEDTPLRRRGDKGDDFWRRFSVYAKDTGKRQQSAWLTKTQNGTNRMSRTVWFVGLFLLALIGGGIALGYYVSRNSSTHTAPVAVGGSANEGASLAGTTSTVVVPSTSSSPHVSPTNTVAKRHPIPEITSIPKPRSPSAIDISLHRKWQMYNRLD